MTDGKPTYAQINRKVWNTAPFRELSPDARSLFFYLTTCPHGNMLGMFVLRPGYALDDMQWGDDRERFRNSFQELLDKRLFKYDPGTDVVLDLEQIEKHPPVNPNAVKAAIRIVNSLPKTLLFRDLELLCESLGKPFLKPLLERLRERYAHTVTGTGTGTGTAAEAEGGHGGERAKAPGPESSRPRSAARALDPPQSAARDSRAGSRGQGPAQGPPGRKEPPEEKPQPRESAAPGHKAPWTAPRGPETPGRPESPTSVAPGPKPPEPSPGNARGERWTEAAIGKLDDLLREIGERWGARYRQRAYVFVQGNFGSRNPEAVIHSLRRLIQERLKGGAVPMPERWLDAVLNGNGNHPGENGRFEAAESEREAAGRKASTPRIGDLIPPSLKGEKPHGRPGDPG